MTKENNLAKILLTVYGDDGQTVFAKQMGVNVRTVRSWISGRLPISEDRQRQMDSILRDHINNRTKALLRINGLFSVNGAHAMLYGKLDKVFDD